MTVNNTLSYAPKVPRQLKDCTEEDSKYDTNLIVFEVELYRNLQYELFNISHEKSCSLST
jgi:hypothetical protein